MAALLSDPALRPTLEKTEWFRRWVKQNVALLNIALTVAEGITRDGFTD